MIYCRMKITLRKPSIFHSLATKTERELWPFGWWQTFWNSMGWWVCKNVYLFVYLRLSKLYNIMPRYFKDIRRDYKSQACHPEKGFIKLTKSLNMFKNLSKFIVWSQIQRYYIFIHFCYELHFIDLKHFKIILFNRCIFHDANK